MICKRILTVLCLSMWTLVVQGQAVRLDAQLEASELVVSEAQKQAFLLSTNLLLKHHYRRQYLMDIVGDIYVDYLNMLDPSHIYFTTADLVELGFYKKGLAQAIAVGDLSAPIMIYQRYQERARALNEWTLARLQRPFDFTTAATVTYPDTRNSRQLPWFEGRVQAQNFQEKRLIDQLIRLMLSGKTEKEAVKTLTQRYEGAQKRMQQMTAQDVFDIYMNTITSRFDPHTSYLSPRHSENFEINMRLSLEGIGAVLTLEDEKITIRELIAGGPAASSGKLRIKDQILGVAQGLEGEMVDVVGWRLDNAVELIRGKKGTLVRLLIESANAAQGIQEITLKRDKIKLEEQAAQANVETSADGAKIGVIKLPSFYMDFEAARRGQFGFRSTSRDVRKLVRKLQAQGIEALVLDLRGNGGGSLQEAIETVGLFIDEGPVVMVSSAEGEVRVESDDNPGMIYDGPLAVMIDHYAASASEIFAAAIQDYGRGVVIGSNSYGKGTVQTMIDLNRFVSRNQEALGDVKFTIAMFHRVAGGSTQIEGVTPDIALPEGLGLEEVGEMAEPYALPWKKIEAAEYVRDGRVTPQLLDFLVEQHEQRMQVVPALRRYQDYIAKIVARNEQTQWSLNLDKRRQDFKQWQAFQDNYEHFQQNAVADLASDKKIKEKIAENNQFIEEETDKIGFVPDIGLYETLNVVNDYIQWLAQAAQRAA